MDIVQLVTNLDHTDDGIRRCKEMLTTLKKQKDDIENKIIQFLNDHNQPGFVHNGKVYAPQTVKTYRKKRVNEKQSEITAVLKHNGVAADSNIINEVFNVFRHKRMETEKLVAGKVANGQ